MSVYEETEDVNKGEQSVTVVRLSRRWKEEGRGQTQLRGQEWYFNRGGSKVTGSPSANSSCHPLFRRSRLRPHPPQLADAVLRVHRLCPAHPFFREAPWHPGGQVSRKWDSSQTSQRTHGNTLVGYYAVSALMWIHLLPSCFKAELRGRPCLGRRSIAQSQPTNADILKVPFRCLPFLKETALQRSTKFWPYRRHSWKRTAEQS